MNAGSASNPRPNPALKRTRWKRSSAALLAAYAAVMVILNSRWLYLLWLGFKALRSAASTKDVLTTIVSVDGTWNRISCVASPCRPQSRTGDDCYRFAWGHSDAPTWVGASIVVGTTTLSLGGHLLYAITFSTKSMVTLYTKARLIIEAALGAFFAQWGIRLLTERN